MTLHELPDLVQGTPEWLEQRRGMVTASVVGRLLTKASPDASMVACPSCGVWVGACLSLSRKVPTLLRTFHSDRLQAAADLPATLVPADNDTSRALTATLVAERISGYVEDGPMTSDMWRGVNSEPVARELYAQHHAPVREIGFMVRTEDWGTLGYSPDGLVGDDGAIEVKAPRSKGHVLAVIAGEVPDHNIAQLQAGLLVSGRKWIDFIPYVGGLPLWTKRVYPDPAWHDAIKAAVTKFETTATEMVAAYTQATKSLPATERVDLEIRI